LEVAYPAHRIDGSDFRLSERTSPFATIINFFCPFLAASTNLAAVSGAY